MSPSSVRARSVCSRCSPAGSGGDRCSGRSWRAAHRAVSREADLRYSRPGDDPGGRIRALRKALRIILLHADGHRQEVATEHGLSDMESLRKANIVEGECNGSLACATCHVWVDPEWISWLPAPPLRRRIAVSPVSILRSVKSSNICAPLKARHSRRRQGSLRACDALSARTDLSLREQPSENQ